MATELIRRVLCDRCLIDDEKKVDGTVSERVALGQQIVEIDLCERCAEDLLAPVRELIRLGRAPSPREISEPPPRSKPQQVNGKKTEDYECPVCPDDFKTRQAFRKHLKEKHGMDFGSYLKSMGQEAFPCSVPGCEFVGVDSAGLTLHKIRTHQPLVAANGQR